MTKPTCVWIIDDDRSIRWVLEKALLREDIPCMTFSSASDALRELERSTPAAVLSDIRMPGVSGLELLQALKERLPKVPVIIMTAYSDLDSAVAAFQGGAFEYLPKPFDVDQALELVRRALAENASRDVPASSDAPVPENLGQAPAMQEGTLLKGDVILLLLDVLLDRGPPITPTLALPHRGGGKFEVVEHALGGILSALRSMRFEPCF